MDSSNAEEPVGKKGPEEEAKGDEQNDRPRLMTYQEALENASDMVSKGDEHNGKTPDTQDTSDSDPDCNLDGTEAVSESGSDLDRTLPVNSSPLANEILEIPSPPESSSEDSSNSSESEDEVFRLSEQNKKLETELKELKLTFEQSQRDMTLANNLRVAQRDKLFRARKELEEKTKQIDTLLSRNNALQDLLCKKPQGSTESKAKKTSASVSPKRTSVSVSPGKTSLSLKKKASSPKQDQSFSWLISPKKESHKRSLNFDGSSDLSPATPDKSNQSSSNIKKKEKKRRVKDHDLLTDPVVCQVSEQLLNHFNGSQPLTPDEKGFISIGPHNVKIDKEALERNVEDYKTDFTKLAKSMAALTWTTSQRETRSLEGGTNNRFPDAPPKKAATPFKVNTCLGVLKAHLLHQGDREGTGMAQNLKQARKSIGSKFAQDSATSKKK